MLQITTTGSHDICLKPCPFCGGKVEIVRTDCEGNLQPDKYFDEDGAWSGIAYQITHPYTKLETECPIATHEDEFIGCYNYEAVEELIETWNKRITL